MSVSCECCVLSGTERSPVLAYKRAKGKILLHRFSHEQKMPGNGSIARLPEISLSG